MRGQVPGTKCNGARTEWRAGTTASSAKGGRPTRTPNLTYRSSSLSLLRGGRPEDTAVVPGGSTTTALAGRHTSEEK